MGVAGKFEQKQSGFSVKATLALIAALFLLFLTVLVIAVYMGRQEARRSAESRADAASQVVATNSKWIFELARQALQRIDDTLGEKIRPTQGSEVRSIVEAVGALPGSVKAYVVDAKGDTMFSTDPMVKPINITDRAYFSVPASGAPWYTSSLLVSRLNGEQIFVFSKRMERGGVFAGVAVISFNVSLFAEIWASLSLDHESTVSIIRDDGQLVARYPLAEGPLDLSKYVLFTDYLPKAPSGVYSAISPADGIARFVGYRTVPGTDLVALSSISTTAAYRLFWRNTLWLVGLSVPTAIALALASLWILRLVRSGEQRQTQLEEALEVNRLLFRDTHHRVKNNLQSVQSLVRMQNIPAETKSDLQGRIAAMTAVHEHMYRLDQYAEIAADELIPSIVDPLKQTFASDIGIEFDIEPLVIDRDYATPLALLVNEVVTNALKYAFPDGRKGTIRIGMAATQPLMARLTIADDGIGFDPETVASGMGNRLIKGMVTQLGGTSSYQRNGGTVFVADIRIASSHPIVAGAGAPPKGTKVKAAG